MSSDLRILYLPYNCLMWAMEKKIIPETAMVFFDGYRNIDLPPEQIKFVLPSTGSAAVQMTRLIAMFAAYQASSGVIAQDLVETIAQEYILDFERCMTLPEYNIVGDCRYLANMIHPVLVGLYYCQQNGFIDPGRTLVYIGDELGEVQPDGISDTNDWIILGNSLSEQQEAFWAIASQKIPSACLELLNKLVG